MARFWNIFMKQGFDVLNVESGYNQSKLSIDNGIETANCFLILRLLPRK